MNNNKDMVKNEPKEIPKDRIIFRQERMIHVQKERIALQDGIVRFCLKLFENDDQMKDITIRLKEYDKYMEELRKNNWSESGYFDPNKMML